ncbi:MAG: GGDEF domain-containing protein [Bacteroidales bacterium]|nr:GGDEF domain-containing protein [Bacteroidales bacterium]
MDPLVSGFPLLTVHAAGIILVAMLLRPLARLVSGMYLSYWSTAWISLACSLAFLFCALQFSEFRILGILLHFLCDYGFAVLLWAGCDELATGCASRRRFLIAGLILIFLSATATVAVEEMQYLFPFHAGAMGLIFLLAALRLWRYRPSSPSTGLYLIQVALLGLVVLYTHYAVVSGIAGFVKVQNLPPYLGFWSLYDLFLETALAFGMMVHASEQIRAELEHRNQQLTSASENLSRVARTDPLTGLLNRRALDDLLEDMKNLPCSGAVGVIDLNNFKMLNDTHGHSVGDDALQFLAQTLRSHFRNQDPIFRTGGDEFLVFLLHGTAEELHIRLSRVDTVVRGHWTEQFAPSVVLSLAWGVSEFPHASHARKAINLADLRMYEQKKTSKNTDTPIETPTIGD